MGIGPDEKLMQAINADPQLCDARRAAFIDLSEVASRLHASHPHRTVEQIEDRLRLVLSVGGMSLNEKQPLGHSTTILSAAIADSQPGLQLRCDDAHG
jgi:hypothetical protein